MLPELRGQHFAAQAGERSSALAAALALLDAKLAADDQFLGLNKCLGWRPPTEAGTRGPGLNPLCAR